MNFPPTRLEQLELENFRCFSNLTVNFHGKLTVLVAPNGGGKTSVLDAAAISLWPFICTMQLKDASPGFDPGDLRRVRSPIGTMQTLSPVSVKSRAIIDGNDEPLLWQRLRKSAAQGTRTSRTGPAQLQRAASNLWNQNRNFAAGVGSSIPTYPLFAYYGTGRLWDQSRLTFEKLYRNKPDTGRESGYEDALSPKSSYKSFVDWFGRYSSESRSEKESGNPSPHKASEKIQALTAAVDVLLKPTGWHSLSWDFVEKKPVATHPIHGVLPVDILSDGLRNTIGLASDIAHRCARINPQFGADAATRTPGIILIDEVDMHLHPEWQQQVLAAFLEAFPLIQFIVTTHSPQVLTTVKRENIRILSQNEAGEWTADEPKEETRGVESAAALAGVMNVDPIPPVQEARDLSRYQQMIQLRQHNSEDGLKLRALLDAHFGPRHPLILDCDRLIRVEQFKAKLPIKSSKPAE